MMVCQNTGVTKDGVMKDGVMKDGVMKDSVTNTLETKAMLQKQLQYDFGRQTILRYKLM
jgi:hypothetical protein